MFARIGNGVFHYKQSFINTHNKNSSIFQQMDEFFIAYTQTISPFGYGRVFLIAYTQSIFGFWVWADISYCLCPIHFHLLGMGGYFLLLIPNPFSPFGYGRTFPIAYTQSIFTFWVWAGISYCYTQTIPKKCPVKVFHRALKHFLLFSYRNFLPDIRQSV